MNYPESVEYLYALGNELKPGAKFGLDRMRVLLAAMGNPERGQRFVHVAGTNGKGSTCAIIASVLRKAGYRTGLYTSPHLIRPTERILIDGQEISKAEFASAFEAVHRVAEELLRNGDIDAHPSYFETVTSMALYVLQEACDISVIEVGLGGRLDATNVIQPEICVITPVAFDHEAYLGSTITAIAGEKAGIIKAGVPVVLANQNPEAEEVMVARAEELGCKMTKLADAELRDVLVSPMQSEFALNGATYRCALPGRHQVENAATAVLACQALRVSTPHIQEGLAEASWPGRLEFVGRRPDFILDGAHNPAGALALAEYIREFCQNRPVWIVYGAMRDKAIEEVTALLFPLATKLILTKPDMPRALRPEAILELGEHSNAVVTETVAEAIEVARSAPPDTAVFFTGSLYLVGEARALLLGQAA